MEPLSLLIYHNDPGTAETLAVSLTRYFNVVNRVTNCEEIRAAVRRHAVHILVLDLETSRSDEIRRLHHEFPSLRIVATHRLADEGLWTEAMNQGADDVCEPRNEDVVRSVLRGRAHHAAAA